MTSTEKDDVQLGANVEFDIVLRPLLPTNGSWFAGEVPKSQQKRPLMR